MVYESIRTRINFYFKQQTNVLAYLEKSVNFTFVLAIYVSFLEERKLGFKPITRTNIFQSVKKLVFIFRWFLKTKLVTWKSNNPKSTGISFSSQFVLQCIQMDILIRISSESGHIHRQNNMTAKLGHGDFFSVYILDCEVMEWFRVVYMTYWAIFSSFWRVYVA